jgi:hypothetical protein
MTGLLQKRGAFDRAPFVLIDAGCSGGIHPAWRAFGPSLVAHAYDPDVGACEDLQAREPFENVHYHARYIGLRETHPFGVNAEKTRPGGRTRTSGIASRPATCTRARSRQRRAPRPGWPIRAQ